MEQFDADQRKYNIIVPNEEFILFVGTSHTFGSCSSVNKKSSGPVGKKNRLSYDERYSSIIENELGIKVLALGYPGIDNLGLLQVFNELLRLKVFTQNCKMVILEPRFAATQIRFNLNTNVGSDYYNRAKAEWKWSIDKFLMHIFGPSDLESQRKIHIPETPKDVVYHRMATEAGSLQGAFCDAIFIQTIKNLVINLNDKKIKFVWMLIDPTGKQMHTVIKMYGDWLDILDNFICGDSVRTIIESNVGYMQPYDKKDNIHFCPCGHFNSLGNKLIAEAILPDIKKFLV